MRLLLTNLTFTLLLYTVVYLIKSFVIWEFTNPIQWIIDIPKCSNEDRFLGLCMFAFWQYLQIFVISNILEDSESNSNSTKTKIKMYE
jgi:hypothetical protein